MKMLLDKEDKINYEQRAFFDKKESKELNPLSIFFAVLAAIIVSWFIRAAYIDWQLRQVAEAFNQQISVINDQSQQQMRSIILKNQAMQAEVEEKARLKADELMQKKIETHQIELDKRAAVASEIDARARKVEAWNVFYKPTKGCEKDNPDREAVKCGNDYIRARNSFEQSWASNSN
jgi:hypothetical protein